MDIRNPSQPKGKITLLLVESNHIEAQRTSYELSEYFSDGNAAISIACTGKEAMEKISAIQPDLVLLDYYLPDMPGEEILKLIKAEYPSIAVVVLTYIGSADMAVKMTHLGADDYVSKKYGLLGIGMVIEKVLERKRMENEFLFLHEEKRTNLKLSRILEVGKIMSTQQNFQDLLATIIKETSEILEADRTSLFIYDERTNELWLKVTEKKEINEIRFSIDKGIAGHVAKTRKVLNIKDAYAHELFNPEFDSLTGFKTKNLLCAPMENLQKKLIGVIQVLNKNSDSFSKEDEEILVMFASLAAVLIENSILEEEKIKNERMAMVGNMASTIIHDIKNPMTSIRGFAEMIALKSPKNKEFANIIIRSVDRLLIMTHELLDFAQGIEKEIIFEEVSCRDYFNSIISFIGKDLEENNIKLVPEIHFHGLWEINPEKIERAIYNIVGNAKDAMEQGGTFTITVSESEDKKDVLLVLQDTGKGIPPEITKTIFDPFVTYGKKNGTGLGMSITKKIITAHGGTIHVESEPGKGTLFRIVLPKSPKSEMHQK